MAGILTLAAVGALAGLAAIAPLPVGGGVPSARAAEALPAARPLPVVAATVRRVDGYDVRGQYVGRVVGRRTSALGFDTAGLLEAVLVQEGDRVRKGDVLARLNTARLQARQRRLVAELALARATYKETEAKLALARATAERQKSLLRSDNVSRQTYDEARFQEQALRASLDANDAAVKQAEAAIASAEADIALSRIVAPFDGTVVERMVDEGEALVPATPVLRLVEDVAMEVRIGLPPEMAEEVVPGRSYDIAIADTAYRGRLRAVLDALDETTRTVPAVFDIELPPGGRPPRSGQLAVLEITRFVLDDGYWLPLGALVGGRRGLWDALALAPAPEAVQEGAAQEGEAQGPAQQGALYRTVRREVEVLQTETDRVFVRGTIEDGDLIVTEGVHRVVPGQIVRLAEPRS